MKNIDWQLPSDVGAKTGVNHNNVQMAILSVLLDIREELRGGGLSKEERRLSEMQGAGVSARDMGLSREELLKQTKDLHDRLNAPTKSLMGAPAAKARNK